MSDKLGGTKYDNECGGSDRRALSPARTHCLQGDPIFAVLKGGRDARVWRTSKERRRNGDKRQGIGTHKEGTNRRKKGEAHKRGLGKRSRSRNGSNPSRFLYGCVGLQNPPPPAHTVSSRSEETTIAKREQIQSGVGEGEQNSTCSISTKLDSDSTIALLICDTDVGETEHRSATRIIRSRCLAR
jgi:hypothetical protein